MPHAIHVEEFGGPEVMKWVEVEVGDPGPGEARIRHTAIGLNFVDIYNRSGLYKPAGGLPFVPGAEGAGVVEAVGDGVSEVKPGDRVVYSAGGGAYAEVRLIKADVLVKIPDDIDDKVAAAVFVKGLTAECLLYRTYEVGPQSTRSSSTRRPAASARSPPNGPRSSVPRSSARSAPTRRRRSPRRMAASTSSTTARKTSSPAPARSPAAPGSMSSTTSIGKDTFPGSLDCLRPLGLWVAFGQSSGSPPEFPISLLAQKGSLFATRMTVFVYLAKRADLLAAAERLFNALRDGTVHVAVNQEFPLSEAVEAHRALAGRATTGQSVLGALILADGCCRIWWHGC